MEKFEEIEKKVQQYFLAEEERLTRQGEESRLEYFRKILEKSAELFAGFARHKVFEDRALRAVVGFGKDGIPRYWNPKEGNLLVCGPASGGFAAQGNLLALLSLCRFSEEELNWFYVARESARGFFAEDDHCRESGSLWQGNCGEAFASLRAEIDKRSAMSEELLAKQPYVIVVFAGIDESMSRYWLRYRNSVSHCVAYDEPHRAGEYAAHAAKILEMKEKWHDQFEQSFAEGQSCRRGHRNDGAFLRRRGEGEQPHHRDRGGKV